MQVIIHTTENGNVAVTVPTGELPIDQVLAKDCPDHAIIINDSELPTDNEFFNAWELVDGKVVVSQTKKEAMQKEQCVAKAKELLAKTDWTMVSDVGLANQDAFVFYRLNLRNLVKSPVTNPVWESEPQAVWA